MIELNKVWSIAAGPPTPIILPLPSSFHFKYCWCSAGYLLMLQILTSTDWSSSIESLCLFVTTCLTKGCFAKIFYTISRVWGSSVTWNLPTFLKWNMLRWWMRESVRLGRSFLLTNLLIQARPSGWKHFFIKINNQNPEQNFILVLIAYPKWKSSILRKGNVLSFYHSLESDNSSASSFSLASTILLAAWKTRHIEMLKRITYKKLWSSN